MLQFYNAALLDEKWIVLEALFLEKGGDQQS